MNELTRQLDICSYLAARKGASAEAVSEHLESLGYSASVITVKRDVAALRGLGADIVADRALGYRLLNWSEIRERVRKWRELERQRADLEYSGLRRP